MSPIGTGVTPKPKKPEWAVCVGGAEGNWRDLIELEHSVVGREWPGWYIVVNDVAIHFNRSFHHWVSLHENLLPAWEMGRRALGNEDMDYITWGRKPRFCHRIFTPWGNMSSGGAAVQVALEELHCRRIICVGIPLSNTPHFAESTARHNHDPEGNWSKADKHFDAWTARSPMLKAKVRSMSGRTRELLGAPTSKWLNSKRKYQSAISFG